MPVLSQDSKKRRVIADSDDEEGEEPAAPKSSSSRSKAAAPAPKKVKTSSQPKPKAASSSAGASKSSQTTRIGGIFDSLPIPSPKAKKQAQLYSFWKKDQATKETTAQPVRENKRKADDAAPVEDKEAGAPKKARQASPAAAPKEAAPAAAATTSGAGDVDASAGVEAEQDSSKDSTPSVNGSEETSVTGDAAASTALTTPADELDKRLGDDVEEELAEMAAEAEA